MSAGLADRDDVEQRLRRLARRAQMPHLVLGVLLLVLLAGFIFLAFALLIEVRLRQLVVAIRRDSNALLSFKLHTRHVSALGIDAATSCFAYIGFRLPSGKARVLRLQGRRADLEALLVALRRVAPELAVELPETIRVDVA